MKRTAPVVLVAAGVGVLLGCGGSGARRQAGSQRSVTIAVMPSWPWSNWVVRCNRLRSHPAIASGTALGLSPDLRTRGRARGSG